VTGHPPGLIEEGAKAGIKLVRHDFSNHLIVVLFFEELVKA
jgi:hypothetical protein